MRRGAPCGATDPRGSVDVRRDDEVHTPGYDIRIDRERAREIGVDARAVADAVRIFFASAEVTECILEAAEIRLRPILMTVMSTVLGAVLLVLATGAGAESRFSIGIVIIGSFLAASILTLFLPPILYDLTRRDRPAQDRQPVDRRSSRLHRSLGPPQLPVSRGHF